MNFSSPPTKSSKRKYNSTKSKKWLESKNYLDYSHNIYINKYCFVMNLII